MVDNTKSLEKKVEKPSRKQWIPIYGIYQILKDAYYGKPIVADILGQGPTIFVGSSFYQAASVMGAYYLSEHIDISVSFNF